MLGVTCYIEEASHLGPGGSGECLLEPNNLGGHGYSHQ